MKPECYRGDVSLNGVRWLVSVKESSVKLYLLNFAVKPGVRYRELGNIIQKHAQANGFSVVRSYCGHGIHKLFHTAPNVPHYASEYSFCTVLQTGHALQWMHSIEFLLYFNKAACCLTVITLAFVHLWNHLFFELGIIKCFMNLSGCVTYSFYAMTR